MASEYIQDLAFKQISQAIMATVNPSASTASSSGDGSNAENGIFGVVRRKWGKVQDVIQGLAAPLKRRSMYDELPEHMWPREHIEMSRLAQRGLGHNFLPCQLTNPTWCDYCGDFIWGLYKQCLRCHTCQYTCHQHCLPAVTLNCKSISDDGSEIAFARTPSPSDPRSLLETSLSMGSMCARPGCARVVLSSNTRTDTTTSGLPKVSESVPNFQHLGQRSELAGSDIHQDFCEYAGASLHHLPQTASAGFVTVHSSTNQTITASNPTNSSPSHQNSSSCYIPPYSDIQTGSLKQTQLQYKTTQHGPDQDGSVVSDKTFQGSSSGFIVSDSTNNNSIPQEPENSEDTTSDLPDIMSSQDAATEKDETDSGYRSGTIPDDKLPRVPSQATLDRQELVRKIAKYNHFVPAVNLEMTGKESFQGFIKVTMNLIRPITMELGARPPSIYELLTKEHIVDQNTQQVAFYMPRDTHKSLHITSDTTTKEVVTSLLKKFHILDHPRKFAMYEQEFNERNKLVRLRRLNDKDFPLRAIISWDPERIKNYRVVLQENETGEIVWDVFSLPELGNFLKVLDREEKEMILELKHKYAYMKQYMERRLTELRNERNKKAKN